jgi:hypothetical protein
MTRETQLPVPAQSDVIEFEPKNFSQMYRIAEILCRSALVPAALRQKPQDTLIILLTGRELGFGIMQSIRLINVIDGKPCLSADAIHGMCLSRPEICEYFYVKSSTESECVIVAKRKGAPEPQTFTFTMEDAKRAGVTHKDNWKKYPAPMLIARGKTLTGRAVFPDICGNMYDPDELSAASQLPATQLPKLVAEEAAVVDVAPIRSEARPASKPPLTLDDATEILQAANDTGSRSDQHARIEVQQPTKDDDGGREETSYQNPLPRVKHVTTPSGSQRSFIENVNELIVTTRDVNETGEIVESPMLLFVPFGASCGKSLSSIPDAKIAEMRQWTLDRLQSGKVPEARKREYAAFVEGCSFELRFREEPKG